MAQTLLEFSAPVEAANGTRYRARACGVPMPDGLWHGWIEFEPIGGGEPVRSPRETTQPNRTDAEYWASGLTPIYLQGSLRRALSGPIHIPVSTVHPPLYDGPAPAATTVPSREGVTHSVLDPFSVAAKGEGLLRRQLAALSAWHLVNIIEEYELSAEPVESLNVRSGAELIEIIVNAVAVERAGAARARR